MRCGAGRVEITPELGVPLAGYPFLERPARGVHDPLFATAVVYETCDASIAVVSLDLFAVGRSLADSVRTAAQAQWAIRPDHILVAATHTHSAPGVPLGPAADPFVYGSAPPTYADDVASAAVAAIGAAMDDRRPAKLAFGSADAGGVAANRRREGGFTNPRVAVLTAVGLDDAPIAYLMNFGCHPTVLQADNNWISSDFPAFARSVVEAGGGSVVYTTSAAGDQSTRRTRRAATITEARRLGALLGEAAVRAIAAATPLVAPALRGIRGYVDVPLRQVPGMADAHDVLRRSEERAASLRARRASVAEIRSADVMLLGARHDARRAQSRPPLPAAASAEVQVLCVGDVRIVGLPVELFAEDERLLSGGSRPVVVVTNANDMLGYAPPPSAYAEGGYETAATLLAPEARDRLLAEALWLLQD
jgi:hypothetical protein